MLCQCVCVSLCGGKLYPTPELQLSNQSPQSKQCTARGPCLSNLQLHTQSEMTYNYKPSQKLSFQSAVQKKIIGYPAKRRRDSSAARCFPPQTPWPLHSLAFQFKREKKVTFKQTDKLKLMCTVYVTSQSFLQNFPNNHKKLILPRAGALLLPTCSDHSLNVNRSSRSNYMQLPPKSRAKSFFLFLFKVCKIPSQFNYVVLGGTWRPLSPLHSAPT